MYKISQWSMIVFLLLGPNLLSAQSLEELRQRKDKTIQEIEYTNKMIEETGKSAENSLNQLALIERQIKLRNQLVADYSYQISVLDQKIEDNTVVISLLSDDLQEIRENYEKVITNAFKNRGSYSKFYFIFSSENFNQAYKRMLYLRQISTYRHRQVEQIEAIRLVLNDKINDLVKDKEVKEGLLAGKISEKNQLKKEEQTQENLYKNLTRRQRQLKKTLKKNQQIADQLEKEIEKVIAEEARKARELAMSKDDVALTKAFEKTKGKLNWPVKNGVVTDKFGEHAHPVMKHILVRNNGIDITTSSGTNALAVFAGTVSKVFMIPGGNSAVILRHGKYLTVYSNLLEVKVKTGEVVTQQQMLGSIHSNVKEKGNSILKFQIWFDNKKLNPELWLSRK